jgi:hypothetical protein
MMLGMGLWPGSVASPRLDPARLFAGSESGFALDLARDTLSTMTPGTGVSSITTFVKGMTFAQATSTKRPTYQLDGQLPYLQFDGVDDGMSMAGFSMGATDAVTVVAAIRRSQSANLEDVIGLTTNPGNAGAFVLASTYDAASNTAGFSSRGSGSVSAARAGSTAQGTPVILTGQADISLDRSLIRRNGAEIQPNAGDQGTGNWAAGDLFLGARGDTSRFFNGRIYALLLINRILTTEELVFAEAWAASRCGVTL